MTLPSTGLLLIDQRATPGDLRSGWEAVVRMRDRLDLLVVSTCAGGAFTSPALAGVVYNLPVLLAFDVLKDALITLRDEGLFRCPSPHLGRLMDEAKDVLSWIDWYTLREGVRRRNDIAHSGELFTSQECLRDIANIESQLVQWGLVDAPRRHSDGQ